MGSGRDLDESVDGICGWDLWDGICGWGLWDGICGWDLWDGICGWDLWAGLGGIGVGALSGFSHRMGLIHPPPA